MSRVIVLLLDSFGIGASDDAKAYGDEGANTLGNIVKYCQEHRGNPLYLPHLARRGLQLAAEQSAGPLAHGLGFNGDVDAVYGFAAEQSKGKDTPSGHWEIAGVPVMFDWGYFNQGDDCFPQTLLDDFITQAKLPGVLDGKHASGTDIINRLGDVHIRTGKPIVYTSADSVFQIAAHEQHFGLERLYDICDIARQLVDDYDVGRVIARPFVGADGNYTRTANRRDLATPPPRQTLLDKLVDTGGEVIAVGKVADIYAHRGISKIIKAPDNKTLFDATLQAMDHAGSRSLLFTNFVDFDSKYGHRRDPLGYAQALEALDQRLPELDAKLQPGDLVVVTADHGCDPTAPGSDHTREHIPALFFGPGIKTKNIGKRGSFADIGQTLATHLGLAPLEAGVDCQIESGYF